MSVWKFHVVHVAPENDEAYDLVGDFGVFQFTDGVAVQGPRGQRRHLQGDVGAHQAGQSRDVGSLEGGDVAVEQQAAGRSPGSLRLSGSGDSRARSARARGWALLT